MLANLLGLNVTTKKRCMLLFFAYLLCLTSTAHASSIGITAPGSTSYQEPNIRELAKFTDPGNPDYFWGSALDRTNGYMYVGHYFSAKGSISKVKVSTMTVEAVLDTNVTDKFLAGTVDEVNGYLYFISYGSPTKVVKIRTSDFTLVSTLTLNAGEEYSFTIDVDTDLQTALISTRDSPVKIIKVDLQTMTRIGSVTLAVDEDGVYSSTYDPIAKNVYYGTAYSAVNAKVVRVSMTDINNRSTLTTTLDSIFMSGDRVYNGYILVMSYGTPPYKIAKIRLSDFTQVGVMTLPSPYPGEDAGPSGMAIDEVNGKAYLSTYAETDTLLKVDINTMTLESTLTVDYATYGSVYSIKSDPAHNAVYFTVFDPFGLVTKVDTNNFTPAGMTRLGIRDAKPLVYDTLIVDDQNAVFATMGSPQTLMKFNKDTLSYIGEVRFGFAEHAEDGNSLTYDPVNRKMYVGIGVFSGPSFGNTFSPGKIIKVNADTMVREATLVMPHDVTVESGYITADGNTGYFVGNTVNGRSGYVALPIPVYPRLYKVDLTTFTIVSSVQLGVQYGNAQKVVVDPVANIGYLSIRDEALGRNKIVRVNLTTMAMIPGEITFTAGESSAKTYGLALDAPQHKLYVSYFGTPGGVAVIDTTTFTRNTNFVFDAGEAGTNILEIDLARGFGLVGAGSNKIIKFYLDTLARGGDMTTSTSSLFDFSYSPNDGMLYTGHATTPSVITKYTTSLRGLTLVQKVTLTDPSAAVNKLQFYSHAAAGDVILGVYDSLFNLLWTSTAVPNTFTNAALSEQIVNGTPTSLTLTPGDYYLAFQVNTFIPGASYTLGAANSGRWMPSLFGTLPNSVATTVGSTENFSLAAIYNTSPIVTESGGNTNITEGGANDTLSVVLSGAPIADVVVNFTANGGSRTDVPSITFTPLNWNIPQIVTVSIINNGLLEANRTTTINYDVVSLDLDFNGAILTPTVVNITDSGASVVTPPPSPLYLGGGGGGGYSDVINSDSTSASETQNRSNSQTKTPSVNENTSISPEATSHTTSTNPTVRSSAPSLEGTTDPSTPVGRFNIPFKDTVCAPMKAQNPAIAQFVTQDDLRIFVEKLLKKGVAFQKEGELFDPTALVNRSEMLRYIIQGNCEDFRFFSEFPAPFIDVNITHSDALFIYLAKLRGIVSGYLHDGTFQPDNSISRAEALKVIVEMTLSDGTMKFQGTSDPFLDVDWKDSQTWYRGYLSYAVEKGIITVPESKLFRPNDKALKSEIIFMFARALEVKNM